MKNFKIVFILLCLNFGLVTGCADYLDIIPDAIVTTEDAFSSRSNAEKFRNTCYGYLPSLTRPFYDPSWLASRGDEFWYYNDHQMYPYQNNNSGDIHGLRVFYGFQNTDRPYIDYWNGDQGGIPLFRAIRECNVFLENVEEKNIVPDISDWERNWWTGEVKFLKAYYHFYLMHLYGPIPIIRKNPDMNADSKELHVYREPIDEVVDYIVELLDEAAEHLEDLGGDYRGIPADWLVSGSWSAYGGRITKSIALAVKAKVLVWAASPLFNGNDYYSDLKDPRDNDRLLISSEPDITKWGKAAEACKKAIEWAIAPNGGGHSLYTQPSKYMSDVSDTTKLKYTLRYAVTDPFNREIIWPLTHPTNGFGGWSVGLQPSNLQMNFAREAMPTFLSLGSTRSGSMGTTLKMAEQFYTKNGLPIEDDDEWQRYVGGLEARYDTRTATADDSYHRYYIKPGAVTAQLNFNREPRFYAYVGFDGGIWEGAGRAESQSFVVDKRTPTMTSNVPTGYYMKKVVHPESIFEPAAGTSYNLKNISYTFPCIRLSDLYLLYAEALNESVEGENAVPNDVYVYVDEVRKRAGLDGVKATWDQPASNKHGRYASKTGMREIIRRERTIELCFEGKRGEDMRRWKKAHEVFNEPIRGWNGISPIHATTPANLSDAVYYLVTDHHVRSISYTMKDYLWPLKADDINVNNNLKQNKGW
jgi:hypothetical protein